MPPDNGDLLDGMLGLIVLETLEAEEEAWQPAGILARFFETPGNLA
jgi:hypothetical protein